MNDARKLLLNLGPAALRALGATAYARYVASFAVALPAVVTSRGLLPVDEAMGRTPCPVSFFGRRFVLDLPTVDALVHEPHAFGFSVVRELFVRNPYLRGAIPSILDRVDVAVDLGANRGFFSTFLACTARRVLAVEMTAAYVPAIAASMAANGFEHYEIATLFVGTGGAFDAPQRDRVTFPQLLERHGIERVDLLKIDIEGSEFSLFADPTWLDRVGAVCMEIHQDHGDAADVLEALLRHGFEVQSFDTVMRPARGAAIDFICAVKPAAFPGRRSSDHVGGVAQRAQVEERAARAQRQP